MPAFTTPLALLLLLLLPLVAAAGRPGRGPGRGREAVSLGLRALILLCLILALAGLQWVQMEDRLAVVFLVDVSDSVPPAGQAAALEVVAHALEEMGPDDQAALVLFGADALVERSMSSLPELGPVSSIPRTGASDLSEGIRLGLALFPPGTAKRMVILSDGAATSSPAALESAVRLAEASGVQINTIPVGGASGTELLVTSVRAPTRVRQGETFDLGITLEASQPVQAEIRVSTGGQLVYEGVRPVGRGRQTFSLPIRPSETGFTRYEVQVAAAEDQAYQNNQLSSFTQVTGPPRLLVIEPAPGELLAGGQPRPPEAEQLVRALLAANFGVDRARPSGLPGELAELAQYSAVMLVDVPARDLSNRQMQVLQSYVRDLGGGLVAVGGPTSYGVGGYFRTPLEETLPVEMQIKDELRRPSLTMVFVIDRSGSMADTSGGQIKLELAKEAALRSTGLLFPNDRVGVVAFDDSAGWLAPIGEVGDGAAVQAAIAGLRPGGGTDILAGVQAVAQELPGDPSQLKHVILLTDGGADPTGIPELVQRLHDEDGITLTTIGIGTDAAPFLPNLAELGGGRYYQAIDASTIPRIFTEETALAMRAYLVEHSFVPRLAAPSPVMRGIEALPPLQGYVGTEVKPVAQAVLVSDLGDPILATWQYGLGRAAAFTSDATGRWASAWLGWEGFPTFWSQLAGYTVQDLTPDPLAIEVAMSGEEAILSVDALSAEGRFLNDYALQASLVGPGGETQMLTLQQVAPGSYTARFTPGEEGAYLVRVAGEPREGASAGSGAVQGMAGWVQAYSPEYRLLGIDPLQLCALDADPERCRNAQGPPYTPAQLFAHNLPAARQAQPTWPVLLTLAALLLPVDIAVRRLVISRQELQRSWARVAGRLRGKPQPAPARPARSARMESLLQAKDRAQPPPPPETIPEPPPPGKGDSLDRPQSPPPPRGDPEDRSEAVHRPEPGQSTASSLLDAKKRRQR